MAPDGDGLPPHRRKLTNKSADPPAAPSAAAAFGAHVKASAERTAIGDERAAVQRDDAPQREVESAAGFHGVVEPMVRDATTQLKAQNRVLQRQNAQLELEIDDLNSRCEDLELENKQLFEDREDLEAENQQFLGEIRHLKHQIENSKQLVEEFHRLAVVTSPHDSPKNEGGFESKPPSAAQLSQEQLDNVMQQLHSSYAGIQSRADEQASARLKGVMEAQSAMHENLKHRIAALESWQNNSASIGPSDFPLESIQTENNGEVRSEVAALKMSMAIIQPQCNKVRDDLNNVVSRIATVEAQTSKFVGDPSQGGASGAGKVHPSHAADTNYQTKTRLTTLAEELAKLKAFKARLKAVRYREQAVNEEQSTAGLVVQYKNISKAIDSHGWELDEYEGLHAEDLEALRDHIVARYATFNAHGRALFELKARALSSNPLLGEGDENF